MTQPLILTTYDWVPNGPRGYVRDLRIRWALEEAELNYRVETTPFDERGAQHFERQPFGQIPFLRDGDVTLFESGAILLHLGKKSEKLMPRDAKGEVETTQWVIAGLNSIEMVSVSWWLLRISDVGETPLDGWMNKRLDQLDKVLEKKQWLAAGRFTIADILMADILRIPRKYGSLDKCPALCAYGDRLLARPAFKKAFADQMAQFEKADSPQS